MDSRNLIFLLFFLDLRRKTEMPKINFPFKFYIGLHQVLTEKRTLQVNFFKKDCLLDKLIRNLFPRLVNSIPSKIY